MIEVVYYSSLTNTKDKIDNYMNNFTFYHC